MNAGDIATEVNHARELQQLKDDSGNLARQAKDYRWAYENEFRMHMECLEFLKESRFLLRQIYYARCVVGTKFCDELDRWKLEDLQERILRCIGDWK